MSDIEDEIEYNPKDLMGQMIAVEKGDNLSDYSDKPKKSKKQKKKKRDNEANSDFGSKDELNISEDDDDYSEEKKKKKKKKKKSTKDKNKKLRKNNAKDFFEMEAEVDDDEEQSDIGEVPMAQLEKMRKEAEQHKAAKFRRNQEFTAKLVDKYVNNEEDNIDEDNYADDLEFEDDLDKQPKSTDPKLWLVKCRPGKEKECVLNLLHKFFFKRKASNLKILSTFTIEALKGYIYIEAFKEANVREAIAGMSALKENSIKIVPNSEMVQVFNFDKLEKVDLKKNQWVRIKSGLYEGDLAQILDIEDSANKIYIKIVPRLFESSGKENIGDYSKQMKNLKPKQQFFNKTLHNPELRRHNFLQENLEYWRNKYFKDGFMIKCIKLKSLVVADVVPKLEELRVFESARFITEEGGQGHENRGIDALITNLSDIEYIRKNVYLKGDKVKLIKGDLCNFTGTVISAQNGSVKLIPDIKDFTEELDIPENYLTKYFLPGDLVTVEKGHVHIGKSGLVVKVEDDTAHVFSEATMTEFKVSVNDLVHSSRANKNKAENVIYELEDLVRINGTNTYCFILDIQAHSLKLLDLNNQVKSLSIRDVTKINSNKCNGIDCRKNPISKGDKVKILFGPNKSKRGVIKCIFKNYIFLYNQDFYATNGIFVDKTDHIEIMGAELLEESTRNPGIKINIKSIPDKLRNLVGHRVKIIRGVWKGYIGDLKSANEKVAKVQLISRNKTITIPIEDVFDNNDDEIIKSDFINTPSYNNITKTPAYYPQSPNVLATSPKWNPNTPNWTGASPYHAMSSPNNWK